MVHYIAEKAIAHKLNIYSIALMGESGMRKARPHPADLCTNSYSVAKVFTMTAIGMLWDAKKLGLQDRVFDILQEDFPCEFDARWKNVTVEHLLTHKAGLKRGFLDIDMDDISQYPSHDFLHVVLSEPLVCQPGTLFCYSDAAFYLLSRIVSQISGQRLDDFLRPVLFETLGFQELAWSTCPHGYCMGATGLYLRTDDLVKLGFVYANNGFYYDIPIVSPDWVQRVLSHGYEFSQYQDTDVYFKSGMYGQMLCFSPAHHTACAWHGYEKKSVKPLLEQFHTILQQN